MSSLAEWAKGPGVKGRRIIVTSRTGAIHALSTRRRFGNRITICGRPIETGWSEDKAQDSSTLSCGQCASILGVA